MEQQMMITSSQSHYPKIPGFSPLYDDANHQQLPQLICYLTRQQSSYKIKFECYKDRLICTQKQKSSILTFQNQVAFNYSLVDQKIWFRNRENQQIQYFISENDNHLKQLITYLQNKCPQSDFQSRYELLSKKHQGKQSSVWTALNKTNHQIYAVKIQKYTKNKKQQLNLLRILSHPNLIHLQQFFISKDHQVYIVMDYQDGGSLQDLIKRGHQLSPKQKIKIITDMLNALQYLRIKSIVHRDLKPTNILYNTKDGNYKLADFGISKPLGEKLDQISGTPGYLAPQSLLSKTNRFADIKSDIYSLGLVLYQMYLQYPNTAQHQNHTIQVIPSNSEQNPTVPVIPQKPDNPKVIHQTNCNSTSYTK